MIHYMGARNGSSFPKPEQLGQRSESQDISNSPAPAVERGPQDIDLSIIKENFSHSLHTEAETQKFLRFLPAPIISCAQLYALRDKLSFVFLLYSACLITMIMTCLS